MGLFGKLFNKERNETVALIDIGAETISGAYVRYAGKQTPAILYTSHVPIEIQKEKAHSEAMLRAVEILATTMSKEGVAAVVRATKKGVTDSVLVSVDAPWQETVIKVEHIQQETAFTFTERMALEVLKKVSPRVEGMVYSESKIIGSVLNGYVTPDPYGKQVRHAEIVILTSLIDEGVDKKVRELLHDLFGAKICLMTGAALRYQAMRVAFPHENDVIVLDVTATFPEIALIRKGMLMATAYSSQKNRKSSALTAATLKSELQVIAEAYPLPRKIFLLARTSDLDERKKFLESVDFSSLWLSDNPPRIVAIETSHLLGLVRQMTTSVPDLPLLLMALHYKYVDITSS